MAAVRSGRETVVGSVLAFTAGFVDTCGFIALFGLFTAHVTGNFVLIGATVAGQGRGLLAKLLALPVFVVVVAVVRMTTRRPGGRSARPLLLIEAALLAAFGALGMAASPIQSADAPLALLVGMTAVAAMAVQNAAARGTFAALAPTTVMTGNVTQLTTDLVDLAVGGDAGTTAALRARIHKTWLPIAFFALGSAAGALGAVSAGFACVALPVAGLLGLAAVEGREGR